MSKAAAGHSSCSHSEVDQREWPQALPHALITGENSDCSVSARCQALSEMFDTLSHLIPQRPYEVHSVILGFMVSRLKHREAKSPGWDHTAHQHQG